VKLLLFLIAAPSRAIELFVVLWLFYRWQRYAEDRRRTEWALAFTVLCIPGAALVEWGVTLLSPLRPLKYDAFIYQLDRLFGQPSFFCGRIVEHHLWAEIVVNLAYGGLPMAMTAVFFTYLWLRSERDALQVIFTFLANLVLAVPIYLLLPVCGPRFAFPGFPALPGDVHARLMQIQAAPNGIPSVHTSTAILICWLLWPWRWGRVAGMAFLVLTVFATLGSGQHYFFDLVCAVPYAVAVSLLVRYAVDANRTGGYDSRRREAAECVDG
jgi:hypothetical protein